MTRILAVALLLTTACAQAGGGRLSAPTTVVPCSAPWNQAVEESVPTGDGQGHGPDLGSEEWKSAIEFRLGVRGNPNVPDRAGDAWCGYIDRLVRERAPAGATAPEGPSYDCDTVTPGSIEALVCGDRELSALDRKLADVYAAASARAVNEHPPRLGAEQRGWIKGRNDCWKSDTVRECVRDEYLRRTAELQATYRLVPGIGPVRFVCDGNPANEVVATFFQTEPATLIAERGDEVSLMFVQPSGSGAKYQGRNETFWEHQGEASITWGYGAPEMRCVKAP